MNNVKKEYWVYFLLLIYASYILIFNRVLRYYNNVIDISCLVLIAIISYFLFGFKKNRYVYKKDIIQSILIFTISFHLITYLSGLFFGFSHNPLLSKNSGVIKNLLVFLSYVSLKEIIRYLIISKDKSIRNVVITTILFIFIDLFKDSLSFNINTFDGIFRFIGISIIGGTFKNIMFSYSCKYSDFVPNLIYIFIIEGYVYLVPFVPNFNLFLRTIIEMIFPSVLFMSLLKIYDKKNNYIEKRKSKKNYIKNIISVLLFVILIGLILSSIKYKYFAIASESMENVIYRGDAVIIKKKNNNEIFNKGDIIAFNHDNKIIVHRIIKINNYQNTIYYKTKGDNNGVEDDYDITNKDIIGKVSFIIPKMAYPSLYFRESFY